MQQSIRRSIALVGSATLALASIPLGAAKAEDTKVAQAPATAKDLGVMGVNLRDAVKLNYGFQGALQGAGPLTRQVLVHSYLSRSARTASPTWTCWSMPTSMTTATTAASSKPPLLARPSPPPPALDIAGSMAIALGCMASMRAMTADQWQQDLPIQVSPLRTLKRCFFSR